MDTGTLAALLGLSSTDVRVESALQRFGVARRPELGIDPSDADGPVVRSQDWVSNLSIGIEFGFQEEGAFMGLGAADRGVGPMVLTEVYFHGARPGVRPYPFAIPFGLALSDGRAAVRATMAGLNGTRRSYIRDTWDFPAFRMTVAYADHDSRIDFVVCMLRTEAPEAFEAATAPLPGISALISLLGKRLDDADLRRVFVPLGLDRLVLTTGIEQIIDFRHTYGFKLGFRAVPARRTGRLGVPLLHEIEFMRAGELESRGWRGELPFDLRFDDSPETVFRKLGVSPGNLEDKDFSGQAFWELPDYALQVIYSTMENVVLRVCMLAPNL